MYLIFDVGGSAVKYAVMDETGNIQEKGKIPTINYIENALEAFVESLGEIYDSVKSKYEIIGIAMSLPGQIDVDKGIVYGGGALRYLHEVSLGELVSNRCDGLKVSLENDGKCAALSEIWLGNAKGMKDACVLIFGTGIGGGIVIDGKVHHGHQLKAGEVSYCFDSCEFEDLDKVGDVDSLAVDDSIRAFPFHWSNNSATRALVIKVADRKNMDPKDVSGELIYKWVEEGDKDAIEITERIYFNIAKYCLNLHVIINPEIILIGGGISAQPKFVEGIRRYVGKLSVASKVLGGIKLDVCKYLNDSNLYGALYNFKQKYNML